MLVEHHGRNMYQLAYRLVGNVEDAKDVVQESFLRAYRHLDSFEGRADPGTWLHRIVVNCALDFLRAARSRPDRTWVEPVDHMGETLASAAANPERLAASAESGRHIEAALNGLNPVERVAFTLRHFEGCTIEEIARTLKMRNNAAKQHIFRAVRKLRAALECQRNNR